MATTSLLTEAMRTGSSIVNRRPVAGSDRTCWQASSSCPLPASGKELAGLDCPDKERNLAIDAYSPDGSLVAVSLGGKMGAPREVLFLVPPG